MKQLYVVLKTVERCNLNCTYCYFFNQGDESYKKHPALISFDTINHLIKFLNQAQKEYNLDRISIAIHGGEPTLQPKDQFDKMCNLFTNALGEKLTLAIQTNATLLDEEWINLFSKHKVAVGVSLDGPADYNDTHRINHKNLGSYNSVLKGIHLLQDAVRSKKIADIGLLCVINPEKSGRKIYQHFTKVLNCKRIDFLFPDSTHDSLEESTSESYGKYLVDIFDEWVKDNDPQIRIRFLETVLSKFFGRKGSLAFFGKPNEEYFAITVSSNGELSPDDTLRVADKGKFMQLAKISDTPLKSFLNHPILLSIKEQIQKLPHECESCCWQNLCYGGSPIHRYRSSSGFSNKSVMCNGLKLIYAKAAKFLIDNRCLKIDQIEKILCQI